MKDSVIRLPIFGAPEAPVPKRRVPPILRMGFRPFFLAAALHAVVFLPWWLLLLRQAPNPELAAWLPMWRHAHEMLFGFTLAVIAGFLLTAVRNWTGRDTAHGAPLAGLLVLWGAGRAATLAQPLLPPLLAAIAACAFPLALLFAVGKPILSSKSRQNYGILLMIGLLTLGCALAHAGAAVGDATLLRRSLLSSVHLIVLMIVVIGGRVIPMFTWAALRGPPLLRSAVLERLAVGASAAVAIAVAAGLEGSALAALCAAAGVFNLGRMRAWRSRESLRVPMVAVLHLGYLWIGAGQLLLAAAHAGLPVAEATALHALTIGVIGTMTLGMMARVALGHSGRPIEASTATRLAFALMALVPLARLSSLVLPAQHWMLTVQAAGVLFAAAFAVYLVAFARILVGPRDDGRIE